MFKNLQETIKALNADVNNVANCEKAKKLRKKLLTIGLPLAIGGYLGVFICFVLFATAGSSGVGPNGFTGRVIIPFVLFMPCGIIGSIGANITSLAFKIIVTGYTSELINETVGNNCPNCKNTIDLDSFYCPNCGEKIKIKCMNCNHINSYKSNFCENCGNELE